MRVIFALFLAIFITDGCEWLDAIKEKKVKIELTGSGLHRELSISTHLASTNRFSDCRLLYELLIPAGAYIDSDSVNASLPGHLVMTQHRFDVEVPRSRAEEHKIQILATTQVRKSFEVKDRLKLPVHIRYHGAVEGSSQEAKIVLKSPTVSLDCPGDYIPFKLASCKGKRSFSSQGLPSQSPSWILIEPLEKMTAVARLPVADRTQALPILVATAIVIVLGMGLMFSAGHRNTG